jgi:hypothetical protein
LASISAAGSKTTEKFKHYAWGSEHLIATTLSPAAADFAPYLHLAEAASLSNKGFSSAVNSVVFTDDCAAAAAITSADNSDTARSLLLRLGSSHSRHD